MKSKTFFSHLKNPILISLLLTILGIGMILLSPLNSTSNGDKIMSGVGLAVIVSGITGLVREIFKLTEEHDTSPKLDEGLRKLLGVEGIRLVAPHRSEYDYYQWVGAREPQEQIFLGRSVLHRIQTELSKRKLGTVEKNFVKSLMNGSTINVLFLDPKSALIEILAPEENQDTVLMLLDIATSIGICWNLYKLLRAQAEKFPTSASLEICVYDQYPYFAYHKEGDKVIVGFYVAPKPGWRSPAFQVTGNEANYLFSKLVETFGRNKSTDWLLNLSTNGHIQWNTKLYESIYEVLSGRLGKDQLSKKSMPDPNSEEYNSYLQPRRAELVRVR